MARGIFSGLIWGSVVAVSGLGGLSLAYPEFRPKQPETISGAVPQVAVSEITKDQTPVATLQGDAQEGAATGAADTPGAASTEASAPAEAESAAPSEADSAGESGAAKAVQTTAVPEAEAPKAEAMDQSQDQDHSEAAVTADADGADEPTQADAAQALPNSDQTDAAVSDDAAAPETGMQMQPAGQTDVAEQDVTPQAEAPEPAPVRSEQTAPAVPIPNTASARPRTGVPTPSGTVGNLAHGVKTGRLPSLGSGGSAQGVAASSQSGEIAQTVAGPMALYSVPYERDSEKPQMAIILIDDGSSTLGVEALNEFPYPLSFAVDASKTDAAARMKLYRDKGFEVLALAGLPEGATASDTEVAMAAYLRAVPEAVAILETPERGLQGSRAVSDQVTKIVKESGHGLVWQQKGLNTAQKLAVKEGVPAAPVFRDFDSKGQNAGAIKRFLDQAAFKAGQEGGVIMLGRLRAETISALLIWGLADRAGRVALVPVSSVLAANAAAE